MTRLRIKTADGKIERITVPDESTLRELKEIIANDLLRHTSITQVKLSLNNKVELEGAGGDTLRAAGICSGDTLWLMTPSDQKDSNASSTGGVTSVTATSPSAPHPHGALQTHENLAAPSEALAPLPTVRNTEDDAVQYPAQNEPLPEAKPRFPDLLQRVLDTCSEPTHNPHKLMLLTVHAVMLETGMQLAHQDSKYALPDESLSRCSNVCHVDYTLQQQQLQAVCEIKYIGLGAGMACVVAAYNGKRITTLNVSLTHHLRAQQQQQQGHDSDSTASAFLHLQQLWTELKDALAMKVFASLRRSAGLPLPLGLLALPAELKTKILTSLQAKDLAMMECCCTEMRHTASNDLFWQPLFQQEFGFVTSYESIQAGRLGWQRIYSLKWADREKMRRHSRRHPKLPTAFPSRGIFAPPGPPGGITGGDYDRLPQPFLSGQPGMFGGGLGGSSFAGQGPAPSFFLGGRGTGRAARAAGNFRLA